MKKLQCDQRDDDPLNVHVLWICGVTRPMEVAEGTKVLSCWPGQGGGGGGST